MNTTTRPPVCECDKYNCDVKLGITWDEFDQFHRLGVERGVLIDYPLFLSNECVDKGVDFKSWEPVLKLPSCTVYTRI